MQTIPDAVLDTIAQHRTHLVAMIANLRTHPDQAAQIEKAIATAYLLGETRLSGQDTWHLSQVAHGGPWGGDWLLSSHAATLLGVSESRVRQHILAGTLPTMTRGKTHYIRRDAVNRLIDGSTSKSE